MTLDGRRIGRLAPQRAGTAASRDEYRWCRGLRLRGAGGGAHGPHAAPWRRSRRWRPRGHPGPAGSGRLLAACRARLHHPLDRRTPARAAGAGRGAGDRCARHSRMPADRFLLLDEPTSSLDPAHQHTAMRLVRRMADAGRGVLAVLHDLNLAAAYADRVVLMAEARVVASGTPSEVLRCRPVGVGLPRPHAGHPAPTTGAPPRHRGATPGRPVARVHAQAATALGTCQSVELNEPPKNDGTLRYPFRPLTWQRRRNAASDR